VYSVNITCKDLVKKFFKDVNKFIAITTKDNDKDDDNNSNDNKGLYSQILVWLGTVALHLVVKDITYLIPSPVN